MKKINELDKKFTKEEQIEENIKLLRRLSKESKEHLEKMRNDPMIIDAWNEYKRRKSNGEFPDANL